MTPKMVTTKSSANGKTQTVWFALRNTASYPTQTVMSIWKNPTVAAFDVQDNEEVAMESDDVEAALTGDEIENFFKENPSKD